MTLIEHVDDGVDDCLDLESDSRLVKVARAFVQSRLDSWEAGDMAFDALLVASELVTNAVLHARTEIQLRVAAEDSKVRIEVYDGNSRLPTAAPCGLDVTSGRGLAMVAALASSWGIEQHGDGKVVWAEIGEPSPRPGNDCLDLTEVANVDQALQRVDRSEPSASPSCETKGLRAAAEP